MAHTIGGSAKEQKIGVVLFQLGGPDSLEAVEPFLYNLFSDPDIIDFPLARLSRPALARLIAARRAKRVRPRYAKIGGRSPIQQITLRQAAGLESRLRQVLDARVVVAMRYWRPLTGEAVQQLAGEPVKKLVLLPLYPQYSSTTTGSSLREWDRQAAASGLRDLPRRLVRDYHQHPGYLEALVASIREALDRFPQPRLAELIFSAHNVPARVIEAGDPYADQVRATVRLAMERGGWLNPAHVCFQSKVPGVRWLEPTLEQTIEKLARRGARQLLIIPVSFVSDHIETLYEIDIEARELAARLGVQQFELMPGLNDSTLFLDALASLVLETLN